MYYYLYNLNLFSCLILTTRWPTFPCVPSPAFLNSDDHSTYILCEPNILIYTYKWNHQKLSVSGIVSFNIMLSSSIHVHVIKCVVLWLNRSPFLHTAQFFYSLFGWWSLHGSAHLALVNNDAKTIDMKKSDCVLHRGVTWSQRVVF